MWTQDVQRSARDPTNTPIGPLLAAGWAAIDVSVTAGEV
jgi:hypothetical protein